jgi:hypothetical protein
MLARGYWRAGTIAVMIARDASRRGPATGTALA